MKEGFYPRTKGWGSERGANFYPANVEDRSNWTHRGCKLIFRWEGQIKYFDNEYFNPSYCEPNVLYAIGAWKLFIKECTNEDLILHNFEIEEDKYDSYEMNILEKLKFMFSKKRACDSFFSGYKGTSFSVNPSQY